MQTEIMLTMREAAQLFATTEQTILNWTKKGHLASFRTPGGGTRITQSEIDRVMIAGQRPRRIVTRTALVTAVAS